MKTITLIDRYIFKELLSPFFLILGILTFIFLLARILIITKLIVTYHVGLLPVFQLLLYTTPFFFQYTIPLSVMLSVLLTFLKLSSDNEITALKACGVSVYRLLIPVLFFCLFGMLLTGVATIYGLPWGKKAFRVRTIQLAKSNIKIGLKERVFIDDFPDIMLYFNEIDIKNNAFKNVFIEDQRSGDSITIIAPRGFLTRKPDSQAYTLSLYDGMINQVGLKNRSVNTLLFKTYEINLDLSALIPDSDIKGKGRYEMSLSEIRKYLRETDKRNKKYYKILITYHEKFSFAFSCITLGLLAMPLGLKQSRNRSTGLRTGLFFLTVYYLLMASGSSLVETGSFPPLIGLWLPNLITAGVGIYFLVNARN